jgi:N-carbamoylputrescine amidase
VTLVTDTRIARIGVVQFSPTPDPAENLETALDRTADALDLGADIVCLPELFLTPYFCQTEDPRVFALSEEIPGPTTSRFLELAAEYDAVLILSLFEKRAAGLYHNTAALIDGKRGYVGKYRKMHIPDDPRYYEKYYFTPGDLGFKSFDTPKARCGVLICWDQWYPEAARLTALRGADILFYPTAIGWHPDERESHGEAQYEAWEVSQRAHAVANGCFVVAVNRVGFEPTPGADAPDAVDPGAGVAQSAQGIQFWGQSFVAGPDGQVLHRCSSTEPEVAVVDADLAQIGEIRHGWPFFRDRRIDVYDGLTQRFID